MIKKRYIFIPIFVVIIGVLVIGAIVGYILYSRKAGDAELVFPATEVGTPVGDKLTKDIGPAGGTLASPDGRLTLTVPQNALTETVAFSIQPVTNKAGGGLGLAYRLEPSGKTFTAPLQIDVHYNDQDLKGTIPAALSIGYQDEKGAWRVQRSKLDQAAKTVTVSATHFTDWSFLSRIQLLPTNATLHPGESQVIFVVDCKERGLLDRLLSRPQNCESATWADEDRWSVTGPGTYESSGPGTVIYEAPGKKPTPNVAHVFYSYDFEGWDEAGANWIEVKGFLTSEITIVDRGYTARGQSHDAVYSGVICDLEKPFTVNATGLANFAVRFVPSSPTEGKVIYSSSYSPGGAKATEVGGDSYTVEGIDTDKPRIVWNVSGTATTVNVMGHSVSIPGTSDIVYINLTPLDGNECSGA